MATKSFTPTSADAEAQKYNRKYAVEALARFDERQYPHLGRVNSLARAEGFYDQGYRINALGNLVDPS